MPDDEIPNQVDFNALEEQIQRVLDMKTLLEKECEVLCEKAREILQELSLIHI